MSVNPKEREPRTLIWSLRNIQNFIYNACLFEFEDIINSVDDADLIAPLQYDFIGRVIKRLVKTQGSNFKFLNNLNPYLKSSELKQEYDIFFAILDFPWNISSINLLKNLRQKSKFSVCYIVELWNSDLPRLNNFLKYFQDFDLICAGHYHVVENVRQITNVPCIYLAPGIDTIKFHPNLKHGSRSVDLCSLGRRSSITHQALLQLAEDEPFYYFYDYTSGTNIRSDRHREHRTFTANLLKSSRYFITNHAKVNQPEKTQGQMEIGYRFFEGAAAGNVMLGKPPNSEAFSKYFDWSNAVIPIAFDEPNISEIISELDSQPEYLRKIQINNVVNSLRKHDWVYRWSEILTALGLPSTPAIEERKAILEQMASSDEALLQN